MAFESFYVQFRDANGNPLYSAAGDSWFEVTDPSFATQTSIASGTELSPGTIGFGDLSFDLPYNTDLPTIFENLAAGQAIGAVELADYTDSGSGPELASDDIFSTDQLNALDTSGTNIALSLSYTTLQESVSVLKDGTPNPPQIQDWDHASNSPVTTAKIYAEQSTLPEAVFGAVSLTYFVQFRAADGSILTAANGNTWFAVSGVGFSQDKTSATTKVNFGNLSFTLQNSGVLPTLFLDETQGLRFSQIELAGYTSSPTHDLLQDDLFDTAVLQYSTIGAGGAGEMSFGYTKLVEQSYTQSNGGGVSNVDTNGWDSLLNSPSTTPTYASAASLTSEPTVASPITPNTYFVQFRAAGGQALAAANGDTWFAIQAPEISVSANPNPRFAPVTLQLSDPDVLPALLKDLTSKTNFSAVEIAGYDAGSTATLAQDDIFQTAAITGITNAGLLTLSYSGLQEQAVSAHGTGTVATTGNFNTYLDETAGNLTPDAAKTTLPATESSPGPLTYFVQLRDSGGELLTGDDGATWFAVDNPTTGQDAPVSAVTFSSLDLTLESGADLPQAFQDEFRQLAFTQVELAGYSSGGDLVLDDLYGTAEIIQNTGNADGSDSLDFSYDTVINNSYTQANATDSLSSTAGWDVTTRSADTTPAYAAAAPLTALPASAYAQTPFSYFVEFMTSGTTLTAPGGIGWFAISNLSFGSGVSGGQIHFNGLSFSLGSDAILPALLTDIAGGTVISKIEIAGYGGDGNTPRLLQDDIFETAVLTGISAAATGTVSLSLGYSTLQEQSNSASPATTDGWDTTTKSETPDISFAAPVNREPTAEAASGALTYFVQIKLANGNIVAGNDDSQWFAVTNIGSSQTNSVSTNGNPSANLAFGALSFSLAEGTELPALFLDEAQGNEIGQIELAGYSTGTQDALVTDDLFDDGYISATNDDGADDTTGISFSYDELVQQSYTGTGRSVALAESSGWNKATNAVATSPQFAPAAPLDSLPVEVTCFLAGTRIATESGLVPVECLAIGMKVQTLHAGLQPIKWIGARSYTAPFCNHRKILPIRIRAHAIAENIPARDLFVSPGHAMVLDDALIHAGRLINGVSITQEASMAQVRYFHIELATHEAIFAEGAPAETFRGEYFRNQFHNGAEFAETYPGDAAPELACLPELSRGFQLAAILRRLKSRAGIAPSAAPGPLAGYIDVITPTQVIGWAADRANPDEPVILDILAAGSLIGRTIANIPRPDVAAAGFGAGHHGFEFAIGDAAGPITLRRSADGAILCNARESTPCAVSALKADTLLQTQKYAPHPGQTGSARHWARQPPGRRSRSSGSPPAA